MSSSEAPELGQLGPEHHAELAEIADALAKAGDFRQALGHYMLAVRADPSVLETKQKFAQHSRSIFFPTPNPFLCEAIIDCLKTEEVDCAPLNQAWHSQLILQQGFSGLFDAEGNYTGVAPAVNLEEIREPFFLLGIRRVPLPSAQFEKMMEALRKYLLLEKNASEADKVKIGGAMACYCFYTEYILQETAEEKAEIERMEKAGISKAADVAMYACYRPLYKLDNSAALGNAFRNDPDLAQAVAEQIDQARQLKETAKTIVRVTDIKDGVSQKVRDQYEEFPYPRWKMPAAFLLEEKIRNRIPSEPKILVAGCGTGHEAAMIALTFPKAKILAVDLSLSSLSYAINRTRAIGISNIEFRQGDILNLGTLEERFDVISCGGVLHHMQNPMQGWRVLAGLLKPDGLMRLALYSKIARRYVLKAQEVIMKQGYDGSAEGIRRFRADAENILDETTWRSIRSVDYFTLSMCRDLLFHEQEYDLDLPQIDKWMKELGLEFLGFSNVIEHLAKYKKTYPRDKEAVNLAFWNLYELKHPDTFRAMYQFWCTLRKE